MVPEESCSLAHGCGPEGRWKWDGGRGQEVGSGKGKGERGEQTTVESPLDTIRIGEIGPWTRRDGTLERPASLDLVGDATSRWMMIDYLSLAVPCQTVPCQTVSYPILSYR